MKLVKISVLLSAIVLCTGCLSIRRTWEGLSPLYLGKWRYAEEVYSGVDEAAFQKILLKCSDIGLTAWPLEKYTNSRIESQWVQMADQRKRLEMRVDKTSDEKGQPGYLVSLRVLLQKTREPYSPLNTKHHWVPAGQDDTMEALILARIKDEMRQYGKSE
jgi:hypothetical protein